MGTRLNKYISDSGYCSRREADKYIEQGRVMINNRDAQIGAQVEDGDTVHVDGERISVKGRRVYIAFNKPVGVTCTTDLEDKTNIIDYINYKSRIFHVGRLDKMSEGLIFLTNDGDIVNKILRAGNSHEKEYIVTVNKSFNHEFITKMASGVRIMGVMTSKCKVYMEKENTFRIILTQGMNRQIRRMCETLGYEVTKLKRTRVMNITLKGLPLGQWRYFTDAEVASINEMVKNSSK